MVAGHRLIVAGFTGCRLGLVRVNLSIAVDIANERCSVKPSWIGGFDPAQEQQHDWRQYGWKSAAVRDDCVVPKTALPYALINFYKAKDLRSPFLPEMGFVFSGQRHNIMTLGKQVVLTESAGLVSSLDTSRAALDGKESTDICIPDARCSQ
jgi:hypothetical protein